WKVICQMHSRGDGRIPRKLSKSGNLHLAQRMQRNNRSTNNKHLVTDRVSMAGAIFSSNRSRSSSPAVRNRYVIRKLACSGSDQRHYLAVGRGEPNARGSA